MHDHVALGASGSTQLLMYTARAGLTFSIVTYLARPGNSLNLPPSLVANIKFGPIATSAEADTPQVAMMHDACSSSRLIMYGGNVCMYLSVQLTA